LTKRRAYQIHLVASLVLLFGVEAGWKRWVGPAANGRLEMLAAVLGILAVIGALLLAVSPFRRSLDRRASILIGALLAGGAGTGVYFLVARDDVDARHVLARLGLLTIIFAVLGLIDRKDKP
jgi:hypothetical protein